MLLGGHRNWTSCSLEDGINVMKRGIPIYIYTYYIYMYITYRGIPQNCNLMWVWALSIVGTNWENDDESDVCIWFSQRWDFRALFAGQDAMNGWSNTFSVTEVVAHFGWRISKWVCSQNCNMLFKSQCKLLIPFSVLFFSEMWTGYHSNIFLCIAWQCRHILIETSGIWDREMYWVLVHGLFPIWLTQYLLEKKPDVFFGWRFLTGRKWRFEPRGWCPFADQDWGVSSLHQ